MRIKLFALVICLGLAGMALALSRSFLNLDHIPETNYPLRQAPVQERSFYDDAFGHAGLEDGVREEIGGLFVNHHLIAPELIAQSLLTAKNQNPSLIVLISPNHFSAGYGRVITSEYDWETPYGIMAPDRQLIARLKTDDELFTVDENPFQGEHGIYGVLPFVKKAFPQSKSLPLLVKDRASDEEIDRMAEILDAALPKDALLVGSFDFSHYLSSDAADFTDAKTLAVIKSLDYDSMKHLDVDSKKGLRLMLKVLERRGFSRFTEVAHTNSAKLAGNYEFTETTSYINGYFTRGDKSPNDTVTLMHFGKWSAAGMEKYSSWRRTDYPLGKIERMFGGADITLGTSMDGSGLNSSLSFLGYSGLLGGNGDSFSKSVRGKQVTVYKVSNIQDIQTLTGIQGLVVAFTDRSDLVEGIIQTGVRAVLVDSPNRKIELFGKIPVLYGFGRTEFGEVVLSRDDVIAALEFSGAKTVIRLIPTKFSGVISLKPRSEAVTILEEIASASSEELRNQIKNSVINIE